MMLTLAVVKDYVKKYIAFKRAEKELNELKDSIKAELRQKKYAAGDNRYEATPKGSAFTLAVRISKRTTYPWKEECERMYKIHFGKNWKAEWEGFLADKEQVTEVATLEEPKASTEAAEKALEKLIA